MQVERVSLVDSLKKLHKLFSSFNTFEGENVAITIIEQRDFPPLPSFMLFKILLSLLW